MKDSPKKRKFRPLTKTEVDRRDYTEIENIEKAVLSL